MEWNLNFNVDKFSIDFNTGKITYINLDTNEESLIDESPSIEEAKNLDTHLAIVGSRTITDEKFVNRILNCYKFMFGTPTCIISGGAKGIDTIGEAWADKQGIEKKIFIPDWDKYGKQAGFIRNEDIIKNCDICLAIWDGGSNGTKNDFDLCQKYHKNLLIFNMKDFKSGEFSGFYYKPYSKDKQTQPESPKVASRTFNRWLPQPGVIKL